eukprot:CAMPEP_0198214758 /NCGR_PEP_ID=MMETSP1445-20131203/43846_1 /TAXON_ID=36898 /ORGANISM="Pyramimonas sp., Strain CCMP2087" /LENGTH=452 /DNA_ID=CAMNT_0043890079 /DNA_START=163 /DNA_END=1521 /DNA_ORIENTATION=-
MVAEESEREGALSQPEEPIAKRTCTPADARVEDKASLLEVCAEVAPSHPPDVGGEAEAVGNAFGGAKGTKRKVALFMAYLGIGYSGMQRNPGVETIEEDLEKAIVKAGGISEANAGDFTKVNWSRAARTDKGVSAVGQVVACKMVIDPPGLVDRINSHLPEQIRVLGYVRTTGGFSAKNLCDRRRYEYVLPTFAFDKRVGRPKEDFGLGEECTKEELDEAKRTEEVAVKDSPFVFDYSHRSRLNNILRVYVGTKNHHNFTIRMAASDPSAQRHILSFVCSEPFEVNGKQFVRLQVTGQSFMLHQIRKMVGAALAVMRDVAAETGFENAFSNQHKLNTPMAPELGLFLDEAIFNAYNERYGETHENVSCADYQDQIDAFKKTHIYPHIANTEETENTCRNWLRGLTLQNYPFTTEPVVEGLTKGKRNREDQRKGSGREERETVTRVSQTVKSE